MDEEGENQSKLLYTRHDNELIYIFINCYLFSGFCVDKENIFMKKTVFFFSVRRTVLWDTVVLENNFHR